MIIENVFKVNKDKLSVSIIQLYNELEDIIKRYEYRGKAAMLKKNKWKLKKKKNRHR